MFKQQQLASNRSPKAMALEDQTLREAFQVHPQVVPIERRLRLLRKLMKAGLHRLQIGSLVRQDLMPQMADTEQLYRYIVGVPELEPWVMVLNRKGLERARKAGFRHVAFSASLSESHSRRNLGCSVNRALSRCRELAGAALAQGMKVRMGLQCAFGGPMLPPPEPRHLVELLLPFNRIGVGRLALCDTAGRARPYRLREILLYLRPRLSGPELGLHLHGQPEQLSANLEAAWAGGADWLDVTLSGRGGCPFLPGKPPGNLSTLSAVQFLARKGLSLDLDIKSLLQASAFLENVLASGKERLSAIKKDTLA